VADLLSELLQWVMVFGSAEHADWKVLLEVPVWNFFINFGVVK
jgi:hypothetical protein